MKRDSVFGPIPSALDGPLRKQNADPRCEAPDECRALGDGLCKRCARKVFGSPWSNRVRCSRQPRKYNYQAPPPMHIKPAPPIRFALPDWCPPTLAGMYRDLRRKGIGATEIRLLIVDHVTKKGVG